MYRPMFDGLQQYRATQQRKRDATIGGGLLFVVTLALGFTWLGIHQIEQQILQTKQRVVDRQSVAIEQANHAEHAGTIAEPLAKQALLDTRLIDGIPKSRVLAELTNALPASTTLLSVCIAAASLDNKPGIDGDTLAASCLAANEKSAKETVEQLGALPVFTSVRLLRSEDVEVNGAIRRRFDVECGIAANAKENATDGRTVAVELESLR